VVLAAAGGALLWLAFPSWNLWPLAVVGPALLSLACHGRSLIRASALGGVFGLTFMLPLLSWSGIFVGSWPWIALSVSQAVFYAVLAAGLAAVGSLRAAPLWSAALWVAMEAGRSRWPFGGLPWGRLGFSQADSPLAQLAAFGGVPLTSFAVAVTGSLLASVILQRRRPRCVPDVSVWPRGGRSAVLATLPWLVSTPLWAVAVLHDPASGVRPQASSVGVAVIQGNVPRAGLDFNAQRRAVLDNHVRATVDLAAEVAAGRQPAPQLVIWPENSSDIDPLVNPDARAEIDRAAQAIGVPILIGAVLEGPGIFLTNAGIVWDPATGAGQQYAKRHPVPFGEYMPARSFFRFFSDQVDLLRRDFTAGQDPGVLDVGGVTVGDVICFEVAYDGLVADVVRGGAELIVVQTNNATFGYTDESPQQLAMGRLRAIEFDRTVVVSATSGLSAVIDADGSVRARSDLFTSWTFNDTVALGGGTTLATRVGAVPEYVLSALGVGAVAWSLVIRRRPAAAPPPPPPLTSSVKAAGTVPQEMTDL
jgi:apolipoprotein N-acyltransferase